MKELWPHETTLSANTIAEAIDGFCRLTKALEPIPGQGRHQVRVLGIDRADDLYAITDQDTIHLVPDFRGGGGRGGFFQILIGAVLIAASFYMPGAGLTLFGQTTLGSLMFSMGASMVLGGFLALLSPTPRVDRQPSQQDPEASKYLGGPRNTVKIGTRIPIVYGRQRVYGHYLSFNIDAVDVGATNALPPEAPSVTNQLTGVSLGYSWDPNTGTLSYSFNSTKQHQDHIVVFRGKNVFGQVVWEWEGTQTSNQTNVFLSSFFEDIQERGIWSWSAWAKYPNPDNPEETVQSQPVTGLLNYDEILNPPSD